MSEGQSTGETIPQEEQYQQVLDRLKTWSSEQNLKQRAQAREIPEENMPPIQARHPYGGMRFSRTLPAEGGNHILEVWEVPDGPKPPTKLSYAQIKYDKNGNELSRRRTWYGEERRINGVELRKDFDIFEKFNSLISLADKVAVEPGNAGPTLLKPAPSEQLPDNVTRMRPSRKK